MDSRKYLKTLAGLGFLIVLACGLFIWLYPGFSSIGTDGAVYALLGQSIAQGHGLTFYGTPHTIFSPLYPLSIAAVYRFVSDLGLAAQVTTFGFFLLAIPLLYILGVRVASRRVGLCAAGLWAINGSLLWGAIVEPNPLPLAAVCILLLYIIVLRFPDPMVSTRRNTVWLVVAGALAGLAYLARPEHILLLIGLVVFVLVLTKQLGGTRSIGFALAIIAGWLIVSGPYVVFLHRHTGAWTISGRFNEVALHLNGQSGDVDRTKNGELNTAIRAPAVLKGGEVTSILRHPLPLVKRFFRGLRDSERTFLHNFGILGVGLMFLGIQRAVAERRRRLLFVGALLCIPVLPIALLGVQANYLVQFYGVVILFMAFGIGPLVQHMSDFLGGAVRPRILLAGVLLVSAVYFLHPLVQAYLFLPPEYQPREQRELGLWMREHIPNIEQETILARKPNALFYAGSRWELIPPEATTFSELYRIMEQNNIRYLVADDRFFAHAWPQFSVLLDPWTAPRQFELVVGTSFAGQRAWLYHYHSMSP